MKKLLSLLMALIMTVTCLGIGSVTASAADDYDSEYQEVLNFFKSAQTITTDKPVEISLDSQASSYTDALAIIKFVAPKTAYYEFVCDTIPKTGFSDSMVIADDDDEDCYSGIGVGGNYYGDYYDNYIVAAKCIAGKTYYVLFEGSECGKYTTNVTARTHAHKLDEAYSWPAYIDEEYKDSDDGGKWQPCLYCGVEKTVETYYAPKTMTLSTTSCYYTGKARIPKVTVKDRKGNVIPASNYKVTCKNNVLPGKATVTVTFNGVKYEGTMKRTFIIKPNSMYAPKVSSPKSRQLKVNWIRNGNVSGYYVQYSTSSKFPSGSSTKGVFIGKNTVGTTTVSNLKPGTYYVRTRAFKTIDGKNYHGTWSKVSKVTVKK